MIYVFNLKVCFPNFRRMACHSVALVGGGAREPFMRAGSHAIGCQLQHRANREVFRVSQHQGGGCRGGADESLGQSQRWQRVRGHCTQSHTWAGHLISPSLLNKLSLRHTRHHTGSLVSDPNLVSRSSSLDSLLSGSFYRFEVEK